jgi:hypothetical protein
MDAAVPVPDQLWLRDVVSKLYTRTYATPDECIRDVHRCFDDVVAASRMFPDDAILEGTHQQHAARAEREREQLADTRVVPVLQSLQMTPRP